MQASIFADVIGSRSLPDPDTLLPALGAAALTLNREFAPVLARPFEVDFGDELRGALADPVQSPLCVAVLREELAPLGVRVGVSLGDAHPEDAFNRAKREDRLVCYEGAGEAADLLVNALCRFVDPLVRKRTAKQWEAVKAMRHCGDRAAAATLLGVTRRGLGERLRAGQWHLLEEADATIAAYFAETLGS